MSKQRALNPKQNTNSPEATEARAEPLQALESSVLDDRWMSKQRALTPQTKTKTPPKPARQEPSHFRLSNPRS